MHRTYRTLLLAGSALVILAIPATAQSLPPQADPRVTILEQELRDVRAEIADLKKNAADTDNSAALADLKRATGAQYVDINNQFAALPKVGLDNGRLTVASADGRFTLALRGLIQFDTGYFAQGKGPATVDLNSGANFRRAQIGLTGTAWSDWSYNLTLDFGGNGLEQAGYIYSAYVQYDGLKPFGFRAGAYAPPAGIEDSTGSADLLFLERPASSDIARNIAGSPGRTAITLFAQDSDYLVAASITGDKVNIGSNTKLNVAPFDEQVAFVGRASWLALNDPEYKLLLDADLTHVFKAADTVAGSVSATTALNALSFSNGPELAVDSTKTVATPSFDVKSATEYGFETAGEYNALYVQGGWFHYGITRRNPAIINPDFSGFYALATWSLTGETHAYDPTTASFRGLRPVSGLGSGGWGAWELKARYSSINLDYNPLSTVALGGVAGGVQDVWSLGVNWYATNGVRFSLEYDNIKVNHVNAPTTDISADAIGLRTQLSL
jgi:phosphate-selective porin OprO/OprP